MEPPFGEVPNSLLKGPRYILGHLSAAEELIPIGDDLLI
jgi:hypothetical protein